MQVTKELWNASHTSETLLHYIQLQHYYAEESCNINFKQN